MSSSQDGQQKILRARPARRAGGGLVGSRGTSPASALNEGSNQFSDVDLSPKNGSSEFPSRPTHVTDEPNQYAARYATNMAKRWGGSEGTTTGGENGFNLSGRGSRSTTAAASSRHHSVFNSSAAEGGDGSTSGQVGYHDRARSVSPRSNPARPSFSSSEATINRHQPSSYYQPLMARGIGQDSRLDSAAVAGVGSNGRRSTGGGASSDATDDDAAVVVGAGPGDLATANGLFPLSSGGGGRNGGSSGSAVGGGVGGFSSSGYSRPPLTSPGSRPSPTTSSHPSPTLGASRFPSASLGGVGLVGSRPLSGYDSPSAGRPPSGPSRTVLYNNSSAERGGGSALSEGSAVSSLSQSPFPFSPHNGPKEIHQRQFTPSPSQQGSVGGSGAGSQGGQRTPFPSSTAYPTAFSRYGNLGGGGGEFASRISPYGGSGGGTPAFSFQQQHQQRDEEEQSSVGGDAIGSQGGQRTPLPSNTAYAAASSRYGNLGGGDYHGRGNHRYGESGSRTTSFSFQQQQQQQEGQQEFSVDGDAGSQGQKTPYGVSRYGNVGGGGDYSSRRLPYTDSGSGTSSSFFQRQQQQHQQEEERQQQEQQHQCSAAYPFATSSARPESVTSQRATEGWKGGRAADPYDQPPPTDLFPDEQTNSYGMDSHFAGGQEREEEETAHLVMTDDPESFGRGGEEGVGGELETYEGFDTGGMRDEGGEGGGSAGAGDSASLFGASATEYDHLFSSQLPAEGSSHFDQPQQHQYYCPPPPQVLSPSAQAQSPVTPPRAGISPRAIKPFDSPSSAFVKTTASSPASSYGRSPASSSPLMQEGTKPLFSPLPSPMQGGAGLLSPRFSSPKQGVEAASPKQQGGTGAFSPPPLLPPRGPYPSASTPTSSWASSAFTIQGSPPPPPPPVPTIPPSPSPQALPITSPATLPTSPTRSTSQISHQSFSVAGPTPRDSTTNSYTFSPPPVLSPSRHENQGGPTPRASATTTPYTSPPPVVYSSQHEVHSSTVDQTADMLFGGKGSVDYDFGGGGRAFDHHYQPPPSPPRRTFTPPKEAATLFSSEYDDRRGRGRDEDLPPPPQDGREDLTAISASMFGGPSPEPQFTLSPRLTQTADQGGSPATADALFEGEDVASDPFGPRPDQFAAAPPFASGDPFSALRSSPPQPFTSDQSPYPPLREPLPPPPLSPPQRQEFRGFTLPPAQLPHPTAPLASPTRTLPSPPAVPLSPPKSPPKSPPRASFAGRNNNEYSPPPQFGAPPSPTLAPAPLPAPVIISPKREAIPPPTQSYQSSSFPRKPPAAAGEKSSLPPADVLFAGVDESNDLFAAPRDNDSFSLPPPSGQQSQQGSFSNGSPRPPGTAAPAPYQQAPQPQHQLTETAYNWDQNGGYDSQQQQQHEAFTHFAQSPPPQHQHGASYDAFSTESQQQPHYGDHGSSYGGHQGQQHYPAYGGFDQQAPTEVAVPSPPHQQQQHQGASTCGQYQEDFCNHHPQQQRSEAAIAFNLDQQQPAKYGGGGAAPFHHHDNASASFNSHLPPHQPNVFNPTVGSKHQQKPIIPSSSFHHPVSHRQQAQPGHSLSLPANIKDNNRPRPRGALISFSLGYIITCFPKKAEPLYNASYSSQRQGEEEVEGRPAATRMGPIILRKVDVYNDLIPHVRRAAHLTDSVEAVLAFAAERAEDKFQSETERLLWKIVEIACKHQGKLRGNGPADPKSPDGEIIRALLDYHDSKNPMVPESGYPAPPNQLTPAERSNAMSTIEDRLLEGDQAGALDHALHFKLFPEALMLASALRHPQQQSDPTAPTFYQQAVRSYCDQYVAPGSPLHTLFLHMSDQGVGSMAYQGRQLGPSMSSKNNKPAFLIQNWRRNLAALLAVPCPPGQINPTIVQLGHRLKKENPPMVAEAHVAYLLSGLEPGSQVASQHGFVLIGVEADPDHDPANFTYRNPLAVEALYRAEILDFLRRKFSPPLPKGTSMTVSTAFLQTHKLQYAKLLADAGYLWRSLDYTTDMMKLVGQNVSMGIDQRTGKVQYKINQNCPILPAVLKAAADFDECIKDVMKHQHRPTSALSPGGGRRNSFSNGFGSLGSGTTGLFGGIVSQFGKKAVAVAGNALTAMVLDDGEDAAVPPPRSSSGAYASPPVPAQGGGGVPPPVIGEYVSGSGAYHDQQQQQQPFQQQQQQRRHSQSTLSMGYDGNSGEVSQASPSYYPQQHQHQMDQTPSRQVPKIASPGVMVRPTAPQIFNPASINRAASFNSSAPQEQQQQQLPPHSPQQPFEALQQQQPSPHQQHHHQQQRHSEPPPPMSDISLTDDTPLKTSTPAPVAPSVFAPPTGKFWPSLSPAVAAEVTGRVPAPTSDPTPSRSSGAPMVDTSPSGTTPGNDGTRSTPSSKPNSAKNTPNNRRGSNGTPTEGNKNKGPGVVGRLAGLFGIKKPVTADLGENMEAYFDKDKGRWVFPGQEDEAADDPSLGPPPTGLMGGGGPPSAPNSSGSLGMMGGTPGGSDGSGGGQQAPPAAPGSALDALMAPPPVRGLPRRVSNSTGSLSSAAGGSPYAAMMGGGLPPTGMPKYATFMPKPNQAQSPLHHPQQQQQQAPPS